MTAPHKAMLIQARDALLSACGGRCNAEYNPCEAREVADALTAAIDASEPKGLFIDMIAQHEGLAEELRDLPEPYDQQALEPCPVCGWKAIVPGEPCLMCERNAKMLVPEPEPVAHIRQTYIVGQDGEPLGVSARKELRFGCGNDYAHCTPLYTHPPAVREPLSDAEIDAVTVAQWGKHNGAYMAAYRAYARAIESKIGAKP